MAAVYRVDIFPLSALVFPVWFLQGMEKMAPMAVFNFIGRAAGVGLIVIGVRTSGDYWLVPYYQAGVPCLVFVAALYYAIKRFDLGWPTVTLRAMMTTCRELLPIFLSNLSISLYTSFNPVILGIVAGNAAVGFFTAAQRLINAVTTLFHVQVSQVVYPNVSRRRVRDPEGAFRLVRKSFIFLLLLSTAISIVLFVYARSIILLVLGETMLPSVAAFRIMIPVIVVVAVSHVYGIQTMLPLGMKKEFSLAPICGAAVSIPLTAGCSPSVCSRKVRR